MQKAKYMERQPEVRWQPVNNGMVDVTLCLNEQKVTIEQGQMEDSAKQMMYEYDYHQFRESADKNGKGIPCEVYVLCSGS